MRLQIVSDGIDAKVLLDGKDVTQALTGVDVSFGPGRFPTATFEYECYEIMSFDLKDPEMAHNCPLIGAVTEQTRDVAGQNDDGTLNGEDYTEARWVTEWERIE